MVSENYSHFFGADGLSQIRFSQNRHHLYKRTVGSFYTSAKFLLLSKTLTPASSCRKQMQPDGQLRGKSAHSKRRLGCLRCRTRRGSGWRRQSSCSLAAPGAGGPRDPPPSPPPPPQPTAPTPKQATQISFATVMKSPGKDMHRRPHEKLFSQKGSNCVA